MDGSKQQAKRVSRADIIRIAREWIGTPYQHQASTKGAGTDCLGLVRGVYRAAYGYEPETPPAYSPDWAERDGRESLIEAARRHLCLRNVNEPAPGDVLLFRVVRNGPAKHAAIMTEGERMIHAYAGRAVCENYLNRWWRSRLAAVFSFPGVE